MRKSGEGLSEYAVWAFIQGRPQQAVRKVPRTGVFKTMGLEPVPRQHTAVEETEHPLPPWMPKKGRKSFSEEWFFFLTILPVVSCGVIFSTLEIYVFIITKEKKERGRDAAGDSKKRKNDRQKTFSHPAIARRSTDGHRYGYIKSISSNGLGYID